MNSEERWEIVKQRECIEMEYFSREGWDQLDTAAFVFYDCVLKKPIGDIPAGTKASSISVSFDHSTLEVCLDGEDYENTRTFKIGLSIGDEIK